MTMEQNAQPIRVAQMMTDMNYGGVEMVVMNYYRHMDRSRSNGWAAGCMWCQNIPTCRSMNGRSGGCSVRTDTRSFTPT